MAITLNADIILRNGIAADFDETKIKKGEPAVATDTQQVFIGVADGTAAEVAMRTTTDDAIANKISKTAIINDLTTGGATNVLSAEQGKQLNTEIDDLTGNEYYKDWVSGSYINTSGDTADISVLAPHASYKHIVVDCSAGDIFYVLGYGGTDGRLYAFLGAEVNGTRPVLLKSASGRVYDKPYKITAPVGSEKLVINIRVAYKFFLIKDEILRANDMLYIESSHYGVIPNGTDYNELAKQGMYKVMNSSGALSMHNCPETVGHTLLVMQTISDSHIVQVVKPYIATRNYFWIRTKDASNISEWVKVGSFNELLVEEGSDWN